MRRVLLVLLVALSGFAGASVRGDIDHQYKRWAKATMSNDVETILSVLAPTYELHTYTGTVIDHTKYEASLRKRRATKQAAAAYQTQIASVTVAGSSANVISDETSTTQTVDPVTSKKLKMIHIHRYLDTWNRIGGQWRLSKTVTQLESTKVFPLSS